MTHFRSNQRWTRCEYIANYYNSCEQYYRSLHIKL